MCHLGYMMSFGACELINLLKNQLLIFPPIFSYVMIFILIRTNVKLNTNILLIRKNSQKRLIKDGFIFVFLIKSKLQRLKILMKEDIKFIPEFIVIPKVLLNQVLLKVPL